MEQVSEHVPVCFRRRIRFERRKLTSRGFTKPCDCFLYDVELRAKDKKDDVELLRTFAAKNATSRPQSVDQWEVMFGTIFKANLRYLDLNDIAFRLLEEVGEVSNAMARMYTYLEEDWKEGEPRWRQMCLEDEIADVSSWLFALVHKMDSIRVITDEYEKWMLRGKTYTTRETIHLSKIIWKRYGSDDMKALICPHRTPQLKCTCPIVLVTTESLLQELVRMSQVKHTGA